MRFTFASLLQKENYMGFPKKEKVHREKVRERDTEKDVVI